MSVIWATDAPGAGQSVQTTTTLGAAISGSRFFILMPTGSCAWPPWPRPVSKPVGELEFGLSGLRISFFLCLLRLFAAIPLLFLGFSDEASYG